MANSICARLACVSAAALLCGLGAVEQANAGGFGVQEQSTYFQGSAFAGQCRRRRHQLHVLELGSHHNVPGFNAELSGTVILPSSDLTATGGSLTTSTPIRTANIGVDVFVPPCTATSASVTGFTPALPSTHRLDLRRSPTILLGRSANRAYVQVHLAGFQSHARL